MELLKAIVLGIIQGLTEFLPVSSSAHLDLIPRMLGWGDAGVAFTAVIQLGTLLAVFVYFRKRIWQTLTGIWKALQKAPPAPGEDRESQWEVQLLLAVIIGTIPLALVALALKKYIETTLREPTPVAIMLILMGLALYLVEKGTEKLRNRPLTDITWKDGVLVGAMQAFAAVPGSSRSGSTLIGAFLSKLDREAALEFSFLLSLPAVLLSGLFEIKDLLKPQEVALPGTLHFSPVNTLVATVVAFVVGYASIAWMLKYLAKHSTLVFVIWRVVLGAVVLAMHGMGKI
ncbi:MAG: undecaprenyl-diphosphatase UppP [Armatimonadetes bacterium]|nr:undecaprenyl-diphosphatase UppP [Armatimonadota bacterium]